MRSVYGYANARAQEILMYTWICVGVCIYVCYIRSAVAQVSLEKPSISVECGLSCVNAYQFAQERVHEREGDDE